MTATNLRKRGESGKKAPSWSRRVIDRHALAHDASHYYAVPEVVVAPDDIEGVVRVFAECTKAGQNITFRSGGTSLSGQGVAPSVLVDTRRHFQRVKVLDAGDRISLEPGVTVRLANSHLMRHGRKLGPDPASEIACTIGGIVANNSSGMACGVEGTPYRTLHSMTFVLPSGTVVDTSLADADAILENAEPGIHARLGEMRDEIRSAPELVAELRRQFSIKNTMGYALHSFIDHDAPVQILQHLIVGSEGTLAFVAEATFNTQPIRPAATTAFFIFDDLASATRVLPELVATGPAAVELLDARALKVAQTLPDCPEDIAAVNIDGHAALLVEFQGPDHEWLSERVLVANKVLGAFRSHGDASFSTNRARRDALWHIRKGLYAAIAESRGPGTSALLEDVAVPVDQLLSTCESLVALFEKFNYSESVIFGHAKDGNIHFMLTPRLDDEDELRQYELFTEDMVELILAAGGTLKAEHGTGRIMAPFVERQYGARLFDMMRRVKDLCDPTGLLNPGVVITDDPRSHLKMLKVTPVVEREVDRCVECGYCEPGCPSRELTLTPRQRIVLRRDRVAAIERGDDALVKALDAEYDYEGIDTCAVDGMCQVACPVGINTGDLVRRLRSERPDGSQRRAWTSVARHWDGASQMIGAALTVGGALPIGLTHFATSAARAVLGADTVPSFTSDLPRGGRRRVSLAAPGAEAVFFSSCMSTMFAPEGELGVEEAFTLLCSRAGIKLKTPPDLPSLCCGTPWKSKGHKEGYAFMVDQVSRSLLEATDNGRLPVVCDGSSCTEGLGVLLAAAEVSNVRIIDAVQFVADHVLHRLPPARVAESIAIHPTCSSTQLAINDSLTIVAQAIAREVVVPTDWGCCAFAGDRGMLHPELTASATAREAAEVSRSDAELYASLNRTCELGMTRATGKPYRHILQLLEDATRHSVEEQNK